MLSMDISLKALLVVLCWMTITVIESALGYDCRQTIGVAFNVGHYVYLGHKSRLTQQLDTTTKSFSDRQYQQNKLFGKDLFNWVETAISFDFDECNPSIHSEAYCEAVDRTGSFVLAFGSRKPMSIDTKTYGYVTYRVTSDETLIPIAFTNENLLWDLKPRGQLDDSFWPNLYDKTYCEAGLFVRSRNELLVAVYGARYNENTRIMSRRFESDGKWSEKWTEVAAFSLRGMFQIDGQVFGFDKQNNVYQLIWTGDGSKLDKKLVSNMKEMLNCFGNSTIISGDTRSSITKTMTTTTSTTTRAQTSPVTDTTTTTTKTSSTSLLSTSKSIDESIERTDDERDMKDMKDMKDMNISDTELDDNPNESETTESDIDYIDLSTDPKNTTKEIIEKINLKSKPKSDKDITPFYVFALIFIFIVIVIIIVFIIRRKTMSRIVYLNTRSNASDLKSAEIPLNNNNKNSNSKDV